MSESLYERWRGGASGIVGPLDGAKPRDILISKNEVDQMFRTGLTMDFRERDEV